MSMFNIIPLVVILISLSIIIVVIVRKFSALANLDVENMPAEKEARFKEKLISERLKRNILKWNFKIKKNIGPAISTTGKGLSWAYERLNEIKEKHTPIKKLSEDDFEKKISNLFVNVEEALKNDNLTDAEKYLIEIIGLNSKDIRAFKKLADLYFDKKSYEEAIQTYEHVLRMIEDGFSYEGDEEGEKQAEKARLYFDISLSNKELENYSGAMDNINLALEIEANNPRFLDTKLEISIINKDKKRAWRTFEKLKKVNPENQKLAELKEEINSL